jgi:hypothetical protein
MGDLPLLSEATAEKIRINELCGDALMGRGGMSDDL